jgi:ABC-type sugar transport system ATPase subunit
VSDEVTVLRDGHAVLEGVERSGLDISTVVSAMLGSKRSATSTESSSAQPEATVAAARRPLQFHNVSLTDGGPPVDLLAHPGEIVGLAGLIGAGHHDLLDQASGLKRPRTGQVLLPSGEPVPRPRRAAVAAGVALVSGDRRAVGLMLDKPLWENIAQVRSVALRRDGLFVRKRTLRLRAQLQTQKLGVKARSVNTQAGALSGGNQQKAVFAKWLELEPQVLLLDDPTRGVDIGAKREMHRLIRTIADAGAVVVLCSTDNQELADLCDRVAVFYQGTIAGELAGDGLDQHSLLEAVNTGVTGAAA